MTKKIIATIGNVGVTGTWHEEFEIADEANEWSYMSNMIESFNATLREGELKRAVLNVIVDETTEGFDTSLTKNAIICPYCGFEDDELYEFDHDGAVDWCLDCSKEFRYTIEYIDTYFSTYKIE